MKDLKNDSSGFDTAKGSTPGGINIDNVLQNNRSVATKDNLVKLRNEFNNELYQNHPQSE